MKVDSDTLLTREDFHRLALEKRKGLCLFCENKATEAHHVFDRKLFSDGGYRLRNAAAVCGGCHFKAEIGTLSLAEVAQKAILDFGAEILWPDHARRLNITDPQSMDKWGNLIRKDGSMGPGPLFHDAGCQKALSYGKSLSLCYDAGDFPWNPLGV